MNLDELKKILTFLQGQNYDVMVSELNSFTWSIKGFEKMARGYSNYSFVRRCHLSEKIENWPNFENFLGYVKCYSKEAYLFLTAGHDIINLREYLKFPNLERKEIINTMEHFLEHAVFLRYFILKILKEDCEEKRLAMLAGLLGECIIE